MIARLKELGALNDDAFAASRAKRLTREGKSRRATLAHLAAKGVRAPALEDDPSASSPPPAPICAAAAPARSAPPRNLKFSGAMARGGFSQEIARRALRLDRDEAEALIKGLHE